MRTLIEERRWEVTGQLLFDFRFIIGEPDLDLVKNRIREIEKQFPWCDNSFSNAEDAEHLSECEITIDDPRLRPYWKICRFHIHPHNKMLKKGQLYAYDKHLTRLAEELTKRYVPGLVEVRSILEVRTESIFKA